MVTVKMGHAAVTLLYIIITKGNDHVHVLPRPRPLVVTFLTRSCLTSNGIHIPSTTVLILTLYLHISALCRLANFINELHNLLYQKPCFISLSVSSRCLLTKLSNLSQIRLILMSCEIYTPYVGLVGIITTHIRVINYIKIKIVPFVKHLGYEFSLAYIYLSKHPSTIV